MVTAAFQRASDAAESEITKRVNALDQAYLAEQQKAGTFDLNEMLSAHQQHEQQARKEILGAIIAKHDWGRQYLTLPEVEIFSDRNSQLGYIAAFYGCHKCKRVIAFTNQPAPGKRGDQIDKAILQRLDEIAGDCTGWAE